MEFLPSFINALVIALVGVLVTYVTRTQHQDLRRELKEDIADVKEDVAGVREEIRDVKQDIGHLKDEVRDVKQDVRGLQEDMRDVKQDVRGVRSELASLRSDLTQLALAVGVQPRPQTG